MINTLAIGRGWAVITSDGKRVGDVIEVHDHYLLVSRGVIFVRDRYLPLGTVERTGDKQVILTVTEAVFRKMDLSNIPPPPVIEPATMPLAQPMAATDFDSGYTPDPYQADAGNYSTGWQGDSDNDYNEMPTYTRAQPNWLIEIEHGLNVAYSEMGYGQPVLLIPGWPFDSAVWEPLPTVLAAEYRTITYDPRGTGKSDAPWDSYFVDAMAGDVHRIIVEQALYDVTLVAWSIGATIALAYARSFPKRIARVILVAPVLLKWPDPSPAYDGLDESADATSESPDAASEESGEVAAAISQESDEFAANEPEESLVLDEATQERWNTDLLEDRPALFARLVDELVGPNLSEPRRQWLCHHMLTGGHHAHVKMWDALRNFDLTDCFTDIKTPIIIVSARGDRFSPPAAGARLAGLLSDAKHIEIDGQSHAVFLEQRAALVGILSDLLTPPYVPYAWELEEAETKTSDEETVEESQDLTLEHVAGIERIVSDGLSVETGRSSEIDRADGVGVSPEDTPSDQDTGASGPESAEERAVVPDAPESADEAPKLGV
jgi:pimeloyl-ACP methyl ester carboxylesterase